MWIINNKVWYILLNRNNRGCFEWKHIIAKEEDNKIVKKGFNAEEGSKIMYIADGNRTRGSTMGELDLSLNHWSLINLNGAFIHNYTHILSTQKYPIFVTTYKPPHPLTHSKNSHLHKINPWLTKKYISILSIEILIIINTYIYYQNNTRVAQLHLSPQ